MIGEHESGIPAPRANPHLIGQDRAAHTLWRSWRSGRMPHAWLIHGPGGVGKATLAFRFARALLAKAATDPDRAPDAQHPVFRMVAGGAHPDLHLIEPTRDGRGRMRSEIPVDAVRSVAGRLHSTPALGGYRVAIVDAAEQLNRNAANALLKPLEEPPRETVLLLISHHPSRVLPTVRSRCAKLRCDRMQEADVERVLRAVAPGLDPKARAALVRLASGSPGRALELQAIGALDLYSRLISAIEQGDGRERTSLAADLAKRADLAGATAPLGLLQSVVGRIVAAGTGRPEVEVVGGETVRLERLARRRPLDRWAGLWEKAARFAARAEAVNLDRSHVFHHILTGLGPGGEDPAIWAGTPLGDRYGLA